MGMTMMFAALLLAACGAATASAATTKLRILYRPNTTALSPIDQQWTIEYQYTVPPDKPAAKWDPTEGVFFIWGDTDFDDYGPRHPPTQMHNYIYNQIVPRESHRKPHAYDDYKASF